MWRQGGRSYGWTGLLVITRANQQAPRAILGLVRTGYLHFQYDFTFLLIGSVRVAALGLELECSGALIHDHIIGPGCLSLWPKDLS